MTLWLLEIIHVDIQTDHCFCSRSRRMSEDKTRFDRFGDTTTQGLKVSFSSSTRKTGIGSTRHGKSSTGSSATER